MGRKRRFSGLLLSAAMLSTIGAGVFGSAPLSVRAAEEKEPAVEHEDQDYEARIGDSPYAELEAAFAAAQNGDVITVLKDCSVSKTLRVTRNDITLKSEDADAPVTISRDEDFTGKTYGVSGGSVLLEVTGGSLTTQDIILDGGAVLDDDLNNSGRSWESALVYVDGAYTMESGTVLQNNHISDGAGFGLYAAGGLYVAAEGTFVMDGGLIQNCYSTDTGGGVNAEGNTSVTATSGTIRNCHAVSGGGMNLDGTAELSGMTFTGNSARSSGGGICSRAPLTVTDSLFEGNSSTYDGGGICMATGHQAHITGCTFTGNIAARGSAIQTFDGEGELPLVIRDCNITGNIPLGASHAGGAVSYMNETGIVLAGKIVMEDNLTAGTEPCDIHYYYNTGASILLDESFESDSTFVLGGYDNIKPGRVLIDGTLFHKDASTEQFVWHTQEYCTEKRGENLYLAEVPKTYAVRYNANNNPTGTSITVSDPNRYTSEDTVTIMDQEALLPIMGHIINPGYDLVGWNTEPDGTGTDYAEGQEINLTADLYLYAKWEAKKPVTVTITYIYNNGMEEGTDSAQVLPGAEFIFPDASRKGYSLKGWYEDEELTVFAGNAGEKHHAPQQDTSYYAAWEKADATISFDADGGKMEGGDITAKIGDTITLPDCTKEGYEFTGWYDGDTCAGQAGEEYTVSDDVTLKAHYEKKEAAICTITFDADGGKMEGGNIIAKVGDTVTLPNCTKEGYEFTGWYDGNICIGKAGEDYKVSADVTLKAHYEKKEDQVVICTITFDADGGKMEGGNITAKAGDTVTLPNCTKEGYEFTGWYDGDTCIGKAGEEYTVSADVTLKAHYEKKEAETTICTVTFDADGGDTARKSVKAEKGSTIILPACSKTGYEFLGWFLASDDNVCAGQAGEEFTVQGDISLKAHFEKKEAVKVTITFDADGGKAVNPIRAAKGDIIRLPKTEKQGYSFLGWYTEKDGGILLGIPGSEMKAVKDMTAYALWEKEAEKDTDNDADPETCKVTFHAGKGMIKVKELTIIKDGSLYLPMPEREGYDFTGWYLDDSLTQFAGAYHDTYRITRDTDFYAKWEKSKDNSGSNGDSDNSDNTGDENGNDDKTQDNDDSGETLNTYTIKYDANGGKTKNASVKVVKGSSVKLPGAEREGYIFKGWYTDRQVFIGTEGETYKPSRSISLYARWENADNGNKNDQSDNSTGNTNDKDNKNTSEKNENTSGTVSGNSVDGPSDKDTETRTEGGNGNAGKGTGPVIQTGHSSVFTLLAALGLCGVMLAAASVFEGKKGEKCSL